MIVIPLEATEGIDWILQQSEHNPYNYSRIATELRSAGYEETADWIDANYLDYIQGVTQGFIVDLGADVEEGQTT
jgi:hypothetical protein